jgi:hypothetical protein
VGRLNARCTVIAACNPKGKVGSGLDLPALIGIGDALLTRFDLVLALTDTNSAAWDRRLASFLLQRACAKTVARLEALAGGTQSDAPATVDAVFATAGADATNPDAAFDWSAEYSRQSAAYAELSSSGGLGRVRVIEVAVDVPISAWRDARGLRVEDSPASVAAARAACSAWRSPRP